MKNAYSRTNEEVRQICRDINEQSNDREQLQTLVVRLQQVLSQEMLRNVTLNRHRVDVRMVKATAQRDNPFDRIMIG
jgi:hypothetical protein